MAVNLLIIGAGKIAAGSHLPALKWLAVQGRVNIVGIADLDAGRAAALAQQWGIAHSGDSWRAVAEKSRADAVSICAPPGPNAALAAEAVAAGLHALCEKPPGRTLTDAQRLAAAASAQPDRVTMIAFNRRYAPLYRHAIDLSRRVAPPLVFQARFTRPALGQTPSDTMTDWLTSDGAHVLDLATAMMGAFSHATLWRIAVGGDVPNVWSIHLQNDGGAAHITLNFAASQRVELFEWAGADYEARLELPERAVWTTRGEAPQIWNAADLSGTSEPAVNYGFGGEYSAFFDAITDVGERPAPDFAYGLRYMQLVKTLLDAPNGVTMTLDSQTTVPDSSVAFKRDTTIIVRESLPKLYIKLPPAAQTRYLDQTGLALLREQFDVLQRGGAALTDELAQAEVILTGWGDSGLSPDEISAAEHLRVVIVIGASVQHVQPAQLLARGIAVYNTADAIAQGVAEHCLLLALAGLKQLTRVDKAMHRGDYPPPLRDAELLAFTPRSLVAAAKRNPAIVRVWPYLRPLLLGAVKGIEGGAVPRSTSTAPAIVQELRGQTIGLIGWGHTARHFARLLQPFGCTILVCSDAPIDGELVALGGRRAGLGEILGAARVISLHRGLTDSTRGMIGRDELRRIRPGSVLINTARGPLIEEAALIERLQARDMIAALDVFDVEPLPPKHPLRNIPHAILTPHYTAQAPELQRRVGAQAVEIALDWQRGGGIFEPLSARQLEKMT